MTVITLARVSPKSSSLRFKRRLLRYLGRDRLVNVANGRLLTREHDDPPLRYRLPRWFPINSRVREQAPRNTSKIRTEKSILVMSCLTAWASGTASIDLCTLILSPVRMAWSMRKLLEEMDSNLQSAGILSPTATEMISPGTSSEAWMREVCEERTTFCLVGRVLFQRLDTCQNFCRRVK